MALFGKVLEPIGYLQSMKSMVLGIEAYLQGTAKAEELEFVQKNLDAIDKQLASGRGLVHNADVVYCEDNISVVYYQLGMVVRANAQFTKRETELFLQYVADYKIDRQLNALYNRLLGVSVLANQITLLEQVILDHKPRRWEMMAFCEKVNFVIGTGLLCLFTHSSLTGRDTTLMMSRWSGKMEALYKRMKAVSYECVHYFKEQATEDIEKFLENKEKLKNDEIATGILKKLEKNYDWLKWSVMVSNSFGESSHEILVRGNFISVRHECGLHVVACYNESPSFLDKNKIHLLIGDLEWKIPNPPPDVYANIEANPDYAKTYLAQRMLQKLGEGLGEGITVHAVPGKLDMKCNFPQATFVLHEYKHRLATGTVCIFG
uniref:Uncharacterized protein LOC117362074 n=1 Tax=Geotrypetes seraphini TaxID=260995 RepID=A0A6P8R6T9_GEOSA|nr:uncharacterized protein LOC117362074 [Geotrypetes seraphini]